MNFQTALVIVENHGEVQFPGFGESTVEKQEGSAGSQGDLPSLNGAAGGFRCSVAEIGKQPRHGEKFPGKQRVQPLELAQVFIRFRQRPAFRQHQPRLARIVRLNQSGIVDREVVYLERMTRSAPVTHIQIAAVKRRISHPDQISIQINSPAVVRQYDAQLVETVFQGDFPDCGCGGFPQFIFETVLFPVERGLKRQLLSV